MSEKEIFKYLLKKINDTHNSYIYAYEFIKNNNISFPDQINMSPYSGVSQFIWKLEIGQVTVNVYHDGNTTVSYREGYCKNLFYYDNVLEFNIYQLSL